jgi:hypothetical protein
MTTTPDLDRVWTRADVEDALRAQGISLNPRANGYRLNFIKGGTTKTEYQGLISRSLERTTRYF